MNNITEKNMEYHDVYARYCTSIHDDKCYEKLHITYQTLNFCMQSINKHSTETLKKHVILI